MFAATRFLFFICFAIYLPAWTSLRHSLINQQSKLHGQKQHLFSRQNFMLSSSKKDELVERLLDAKSASKLTFDEIANKLGVTNAYAAQLFMNQAQLKPATAARLKEAVPQISEKDLQEMMKVPFMRSFDPTIMQEPFVYRMVELMQHYGSGLKQLMNEKKGDGIISAIDCFVTMDLVQGALGEDRLVLTINGKFLSHIEQLTENNTVIISQKKK